MSVALATALLEYEGIVLKHYKHLLIFKKTTFYNKTISKMVVAPTSSQWGIMDLF